MQSNKEFSFQVQVPGKWILAGEHTVLRGGDAVVFPLPSRYLTLTYFKTEHEIEIHLQGTDHPELELIIWSVFEKALKNLNLKRRQLSGRIELDSHILFGAGMGASATLCVALTEFFGHLGYIQDKDKYTFATDLENLFHGESSGVDVAVTLYKKPLLFSRINGFKPLELNSKPLLFLSHTGARGVTKDCVDKVKQLFLSNPQLAERIDKNMMSAVQKFKELTRQERVDIDSWAKTMTTAHRCFEQWGLVNEAVTKHTEILFRGGALAVKLTGSGGGGFVLSLWSEMPNEQSMSLPFEMIPCFQASLSEK